MNLLCYSYRFILLKYEFDSYKDAEECTSIDLRENFIQKVK